MEQFQYECNLQKRRTTLPNATDLFLFAFLFTLQVLFLVPSFSLYFKATSSELPNNKNYVQQIPLIITRDQGE